MTKTKRRRIIWSAVFIILIILIVRNCTFSENTDRRFITDKNGSEQKIMNILVRPYPQSVAGQPISYGYNRKKETFWLRYVPNPEITAPTEIYLPESSYPEGGSIETDMPENKWHAEWDKTTGVLQIFTGECEPNKYKITISPN